MRPIMVQALNNHIINYVVWADHDENKEGRWHEKIYDDDDDDDDDNDHKKGEKRGDIIREYQLKTRKEAQANQGP